MPFLVRQSASLSTTFIECLMREGAMRQRGDVGSGLEGQPGQWQSQRKETSLRDALEEASQQGQPGERASHMTAVHAKGLFLISELTGSSPKRQGTWFYLLQASVSSTAKWTQTRSPRGAKPVFARGSFHHAEVRGQRKLRGGHVGTAVLPLQLCETPHPFGSVKTMLGFRWGQGYEIAVLRSGWGDDKRIAICTFGSSTCSVLSCLCDLCWWKQVYGWMPV